LLAHPADDLTAVGQFDLAKSTSELHEKIYSCRGCGLELDDDHEDLIEALDARRREMEAGGLSGDLIYCCAGSAPGHV
jgi:hypothetical protein